MDYTVPVAMSKPYTASLIHLLPLSLSLSLSLPSLPGLDVDNDHILEMACIVTDGDMNIIAEVRFHDNTHVHVAL